MKKLVKLFICMLTLVAGIGMAVANPAINVVNAIETMSGINVNNAKGTFGFSVGKMVTSVDASVDQDKEDFYIPFPTVSDGTAVVKVNVNDGKVTHTYTIGGADTSRFVKANDDKGVYFKYNKNTTHKVYYTAEVSNLTYSSSFYYVEVSGISYSFDNSYQTLMPKEAGINDKMLIPSIKVLDANGDDVGANIVTKVIKNNVELVVNEANSGLISEDDKLYLQPTSIGTYTIRYVDVAHNLTKDYYTISVGENFDSSKVELSASTLTMDAVELGETATFPKPVVSDTYNNVNDVNVDVVISIYKKDGTTLVKKLDANVYEYKFAEAGSYVVKYELSNYYLNHKTTKTISISDNVVVSDTTAPTVYFAKDYNTLDKTQEGWEDNVVTTQDYVVPTKVGYNGITLPALYATDLGTAYGNMTFQRVLISNSGTEYDIDSAEDNASLANDYTKDITKSVNFTFKQNDGESNDAYITRIKGNYTLVYRAVETVGENSVQRTGTKSVSIQILGIDASTYNDNTHLAISLPSIASEMGSDEVKTVNVTSASDDADKAIETHYYFYYGEESIFTSAFDTHKGGADFATNYTTFHTSFNGTNTLHELEVEDNKLTIELEDYSSQSKFTVVAVAINDQGHFVTATKEISIKNTTTDTNAPTASLVASTDFDKTQYILGTDEIVNLPSVTFADVEDKKLSISAEYYIDTPKDFETIQNVSYVEDKINHTWTVSDAEIRPHRAGIYYVVYTATDDANNNYTFVTSFEVVKVATYSLVAEYDTTVDIYNSTSINAKIVNDDGEEVDGDIEVTFKSLAPVCEGTTYTFNYVGDYAFEIKAKVGGNYIDSTINGTIKVNDVDYVWDNEDEIDAPKTSQLSPSKEYEELTIEPSDFATNYANYYKKVSSNYVALTSAETFVAGNYYKKNELIYVQLTVPTANKNGRSQLADIKVTNPSGEEVELLPVVVNDEETGDVKFLASKEGKYTITYSIGGLEEVRYTTVGDNNIPVVKISDKSSLQKDITYTGDSITYKLTYVKNDAKSNSQENVYTVTISATTSSTTIYSYETELSLYDIDRQGAKVALTWANAIKNSSITLNGNASESTSEYTWTIASVGDYTLSIVAKDSNENESASETIKFNVVEESNAKDKEDNKVGIILIVISIVVLAGLICFFAFGGKTKTVSLKSNKAKKEVKVEDAQIKE